MVSDLKNNGRLFKEHKQREHKLFINIVIVAIHVRLDCECSENSCLNRTEILCFKIKN